MASQQDLFRTIESIYSSSGGAISNEQLYAELCAREVISESEIKQDTVEIGGTTYSRLKRKIRWFQQTLKAAGVLEKDEVKRGFWKFAKTTEKLTEIKTGFIIVGFSTLLGFSAVADAKTMLSRLDEKVDLFFTSPPYPLKNQMHYGNVSEREYVDWLSGFVELAVDKMQDSGSMVFNLSPNIFLTGSPARSTYLERFVISMEDRFGLAMMDRGVWFPGNKPRGPVQWVSLKRTHLNAGYEYMLWFAKDPAKVKSNNQNVLLPHTEAHKRLMMSGGDKSARVNGNGSYSVRKGAFSNVTEGKIANNVIQIGTNCQNQRAYKKFCREAGIEAHGAPMPLRLAEFYVKFMTNENDLCMDWFGGSGTLGLACEKNNRRWITVDKTFDYVAGSASRFKDFDGFEYNHSINGFMA